MTPWKYTDDSYRDYTRTAWNESARKYTKLLRNLEPYGFDLIARVDPKVRERCLDIATGPGEPAMSLARMVGLDGKVTGIDLSEHMVELAAEAAKVRRIPNAEFRVMDAEKWRNCLRQRDTTRGRKYGRPTRWFSRTTTTTSTCSSKGRLSAIPSEKRTRLCRRRSSPARGKICADGGRERGSRFPANV